MKKMFIILSLILLVAACTSTPPPGTQIGADPFYKSFYEQTRLIMSREEIRIYKHLPGKEAKAKFIEEFWKKRDPTPDTDENEIKEEFQERIAYANKWFNEHRSKDRGWDTPRGRILLQIGLPEERYWGDVPDTGRSGRLNSTQPYPMEVWIYYRYQMRLVFYGDRQGFGTFRLGRPPAQLATVLALAKKRLDLGSKKPKKDSFKFTAEFRDGSLVIRIPTKRVSFEEKDNKMTADFRVEIHVYRGYNKVETVVKKKSVSEDRADLLNTGNIEFSIPYSPPEKGQYQFDIIIMEEASSEKYRSFLKKKF
ncbi:MAG: GWxTD domain-containing protein [Candidatus Aminicenantes bacterium]|nr:GWxTD domain-containing protein [Candidatus Aminicenantes bacterium]